MGIEDTVLNPRVLCHFRRRRNFSLDLRYATTTCAVLRALRILPSALRRPFPDHRNKK